jgi:hypothetical protein
MNQERPNILAKFWSPSCLQASVTIAHWRYKLVVYEGEIPGELFDLESDPDEFHNLWDDPNCSSLKAVLIERHFRAYLSTVSAGIEWLKESRPGAGLAPKSPSVYD